MKRNYLQWMSFIIVDGSFIAGVYTVPNVFIFLSFDNVIPDISCLQTAIVYPSHPVC